jgi:ketosteroid isomerase-like protein
VLDTLARYRAAYQSLDADAVARVFTGADVRDLRRAFKQAKSMSVGIDLAGCETAVTGDTATAACSVTRVTEPKAGERMTRSQRETFHLRRTPSGWVVERVQ